MEDDSFTAPPTVCPCPVDPIGTDDGRITTTTVPVGIGLTGEIGGLVISVQTEAIERGEPAIGTGRDLGTEFRVRMSLAANNRANVRLGDVDDPVVD